MVIVFENFFLEVFDFLPGLIGLEWTSRADPTLENDVQVVKLFSHCSTYRRKLKTFRTQLIVFVYLSENTIFTQKLLKHK